MSAVADMLEALESLRRSGRELAEEANFTSAVNVDEAERITSDPYPTTDPEEGP